MEKNLNGNRNKDSPLYLQQEGRKWYHSHNLRPREMPSPKMSLRCQAFTNDSLLKYPKVILIQLDQPGPNRKTGLESQCSGRYFGKTQDAAK